MDIKLIFGGECSGIVFIVEFKINSQEEQ